MSKLHASGRKNMPCKNYSPDLHVYDSNVSDKYGVTACDYKQEKTSEQVTAQGNFEMLLL